MSSGDAARTAATRAGSEAAFLRSPDAQLVLDADRRLALVNDAAVQALDLSLTHLGRPFEETDVATRVPELRTLVSRAQNEDVPLGLRDLPWDTAGASRRYWDVQVTPLGRDGGVLGVQLAFVDVTRHHELVAELQAAQVQVQVAYDELQSSAEELETTNEELQSAVQELETTNEELQSTNEELQTMNEELRSTNEELQTVNDELRERISEVGEVNAFLESVLAGLNTAVAVVDSELKVIVWNERAEHLWGLRAVEVEGERLALLPGSLPVEAMLATVRSVLLGPASQDLGDAGATTMETDRFGTKVLLTLAGSPLLGRSGEIRGAILTMEHHDLAGPAS